MLIFAFIIVAIEATVRIVFHNITPLGSSKNLFQKNRFGNSKGLTPNIKGVSFGAEVVTDNFGFRIEPHLPSFIREHSILFLGDSVSFGPGVSSINTFPFILQNRIKDYHIINASVIGYSAKDYYNVLNHLLDSGLGFDGVIVSICLNDFSFESQELIHKSLSEDQHNTRYSNQFLRFLRHISDHYINFNSFLREYSRTYLLIKSLATDTQKNYFLADLVTFEFPGIEGNIYHDLLTINNLAINNGKWVIFFIFPYEFQLRADSYNRNDIIKPQKIIDGAARKDKLPVIDLLPCFKTFLDKSKLKSADLYIFDDPMHLSLVGHKVAAQCIYEEITKRGLAN